MRCGTRLALPACMTSQQDVFQLLQDQHDEVRNLFQEIRRAKGSPERLAELHREVEKKILVHSKAEEAVIYEKLEDLDDLAKKMRENKREHKEVENLLEQMAKIEYTANEWQTAFAQLVDAIEHHASDEETNQFPRARQLLSKDQQRQLLDEYQREFDKRERTLIGPSQLESTTLDELRKHARQIGIERAGDYSKNELISEIRKSA